MLFRRKLGTKAWLWRTDCASWPSAHAYEEREVPLPPGEVCPDCVALDTRDQEKAKAQRPTHVIDKVYFRDRAARAREQAERSASPNMRPVLNDIANECDKLADTELKIEDET